MKHIVMFSGGVGSWMTARRVAAEHGTDNLILLFADTKIEDEDTYRFLGEAAANVGGTLVKLQEGRDPWEIFMWKRFIGNTRLDPCSFYLKRELLRKWLEVNHTPAETVIYLGMDWSEINRFTRAKKRWSPWTVKAPMCDPPYLEKPQMIAEMERQGIQNQRLYKLGFKHANCGGFCVKAGHAHFKRLLETMPERFAYHEGRERDLRAHLGKDVAVLKESVKGKTRPLTLQSFRERLERQETIDLTDEGGCGCFTP